MTCPMCEARIIEAVRIVIPQARKIRSSYSRNITTFFSETSVDPNDLRRAIEDAGYVFISASYEPYRKKRFFGLF